MEFILFIVVAIGFSTLFAFLPLLFFVTELGTSLPLSLLILSVIHTAILIVIIKFFDIFGERIYFIGGNKYRNKSSNLLNEILLISLWVIILSIIVYVPTYFIAGESNLKYYGNGINLYFVPMIIPAMTIGLINMGIILKFKNKINKLNKDINDKKESVYQRQKILSEINYYFDSIERQTLLVSLIDLCEKDNEQTLLKQFSNNQENGFLNMVKKISKYLPKSKEKSFPNNIFEVHKYKKEIEAEIITLTSNIQQLQDDVIELSKRIYGNEKI